MKRQIKQLTFREKVEAFLNQLEIARLEEGSPREEPFFQVAVDDFCSRVAKAVEPCANGAPIAELTVGDKVEIKAPKDEVWRVESTLFMVVEKVECRLFNANSIFGISRNMIVAHFQHNTDESDVYSFTWHIKFRDIREPSKYPTVESTLEDIQLKKGEIRARRSNPAGNALSVHQCHLVDCAAERYEETSDNTSLQLQLKTPTQKV